MTQRVKVTGNATEEELLELDHEVDQGFPDDKGERAFSVKGAARQWHG